MFLYYRLIKQNPMTLYAPQKLNYRAAHTPNSALIKAKFVVMATEKSFISRYVMPLLYLTRMAQFFLMYFKFITLRSTYLLGRELRQLTQAHRTTTLLNAHRSSKIPTNLLLRFRIPFIFVQYPLQMSWTLSHHRIIQLAFGLYKMQRMYRLWSFKA